MIDENKDENLSADILQNILATKNPAYVGKRSFVVGQ